MFSLIEVNVSPIHQQSAFCSEFFKNSYYGFFVKLDLKYYSNLAATLIHHLGQFRLILYWVTKIWCQKNKINTTRLWSSEALKSVLITAKNKKKTKKKFEWILIPRCHTYISVFYCTDLGMIIIPKINKDYHPLVIK